MSSAPSALSDIDVPEPEPRLIDRVLRPLTSFTHNRLAGAALLMTATVGALLLANSPWSDVYHHWLETTLRVEVGGATLEKSFHHFINDGLMAIFFFYVGLEIKREVLVGELADVRKATLPAVAALGGMTAPALIYAAVNAGGSTLDGWGIPMATDIAFALGVLALLGDRVPTGLKVFLTALAIVDDIGAVLVIALFYTDALALTALMAGLACLAASAGLNRLGVRSTWAYYLLGLLAWLGFVESGVHATIAAVLLAFTIPARTRIDGEDFEQRIEGLMSGLDREGLPEDTKLNSGAQQKLFELMDQTIDQASAPAQRIERALHAPVTFLVLPLFAFANAGMDVRGLDVGSTVTSPVVIGIVAGLCLGKTVGIVGSSFLAVRAGIADLPRGVTWMKLTGVGLLAGVGFTMALFIANLAFEDPARAEAAKLGILTASLMSGTLGYALLRRSTSDPG